MEGAARASFVEPSRASVQSCKYEFTSFALKKQGELSLGNFENGKKEKKEKEKIRTRLIRIEVLLIDCPLSCLN